MAKDKPLPSLQKTIEREALVEINKLLDLCNKEFIKIVKMKSEYSSVFKQARIPVITSMDDEGQILHYSYIDINNLFTNPTIREIIIQELLPEYTNNIINNIINNIKETKSC